MGEEEYQRQVEEADYIRRMDQYLALTFEEVEDEPPVLSVHDLYQDLHCYQCGVRVDGEMTITINKKTPDRNDRYGRDGYTAACPEHVGLIGTTNYFSELAPNYFSEEVPS